MKQPPPEVPYILTFDDGPHAAALGRGANRTEHVLDVLAAEDIRAMFFIQTAVGYRGASAVGRSLVRRMNDEGHLVAIHTGGTTDHELHTVAEAAGRLMGELEAAKAYITATTAPLDATDPPAQVPVWVRPPTGAYDAAVLATYARVGLTNLLWDVDGDGGRDLALSDLAARVRAGIDRVARQGWVGGTAAGSKIVVLHHDIQRGPSLHLQPIIDEIRTYTKAASGGASTARFVLP